MASMPWASPDIWFASAAHGDLGAGTGPCLFSLAGAQIKVLIKESSETFSARRPGVSVRGGFFRNMNLSWSSTLSQMKGVFRGEGTLVQSLKRHRHVARGLYSCPLCAWSNNHSPQELQCLPPPSSCCQQLPHAWWCPFSGNLVVPPPFLLHSMPVLGLPSLCCLQQHRSNAVCHRWLWAGCCPALLSGFRNRQSFLSDNCFSCC